MPEMLPRVDFSSKLTNERLETKAADSTEKLSLFNNNMMGTPSRSGAIESRSVKKPFTVVIEGNIGSGKTTLLNHFSNFTNICLLREPVDTWMDLDGHNLLDLMYKDPAAWAMTFQSYVSLTMVQMHQQETHHPIKLMERSLYSARYIFVENMKRTGIIHPGQFAVLKKWYEHIESTTDLHVDLIVYLRTSPEVVFERIKGRARSGEQYLPLEYLQKLHNLHENWLWLQNEFTLPARVFVLDADLDLSKMPAEYNLLKKKLSAFGALI